MAALLVWLARLIPYLVGLLPVIWKKFIGLRAPVRLAIIVGLLALFPVPEWVSELPGLFGELPASVGYFTGLIKLRFGISVVFGALVLRMIWREISKSV